MPAAVPPAAEGMGEEGGGGKWKEERVTTHKAGAALYSQQGKKERKAGQHSVANGGRATPAEAEAEGERERGRVKSGEDSLSLLLFSSLLFSSLLFSLSLLLLLLRHFTCSVITQNKKRRNAAYVQHSARSSVMPSAPLFSPLCVPS